MEKELIFGEYRSTNSCEKDEEYMLKEIEIY